MQHRSTGNVCDLLLKYHHIHSPSHPGNDDRFVLKTTSRELGKYRNLPVFGVIAIILWHADNEIQVFLRVILDYN
jgi:hypothetical protein